MIDLRLEENEKGDSGILSILCYLAIVVTNLSPFVLILDYSKGKRKLEKFPEWMFVTGILFAAINLSYNVLFNDTLKILLHSFCLTAQILVATTFSFMLANKNFSKWFLYVVIAYNLTIEVLYIFSNAIIYHEGIKFAEKATKYVDAIVLVLNVAATGHKIFDVFKNEDFPLIPIVTSICQFITCLLCSIYGILGFKEMNGFVFIPNLLGVLLAGVQIVCYFLYSTKRGGIPPADETKNDDDSKIEGEGNVDDEENACKLLEK